MAVRASKNTVEWHRYVRMAVVEVLYDSVVRLECLNFQVDSLSDLETLYVDLRVKDVQGRAHKLVGNVDKDRAVGAILLWIREVLEEGGAEAPDALVDAIVDETRLLLKTAVRPPGDPSDGVEP